MNPSWWGTPSPDEGKYRNTSLSPSWAESPVSTSSQANAISTGQWAFVSNQTPSIQSILLSESETGSLNRPLKLMHLNEYPGWVDRFYTYVLGQNTELWLRFITDFDQTIEVAASSAATFADLPEDQKKTYDLEKKAYAILTQALSKDIYHQFVSFKTRKKLWDALKTRGVGNEATRQLRHDLLKKEFDGFTCMDKESLGDMTSRFYHLLTELGNFGVVTTPVELLENKDQEETLKAKKVPVPQNPEMYYGTSSTSSARPVSHAPLQTAFVTSTDLYGNQIQVPVKPAPTTGLYGNPLQPVHQQQAYRPSTVATDLYGNPLSAQQQVCYGSTSSSGQQSKPNTVRLDTSSFLKVSVEVAKEHMELLNTLVSSYCGLVEGQIGNINLTQEDYQQIDKEEMDLMDIKWAFASAVRRAKDFMERTGRTSLESKKDTKECTKPAQHGNQNPFRNQSNQQNQNRNNERTLIPVNNQSQAGPSNANQVLMVLVDEGCDWSILLSGDAPDGTACFAEVVKNFIHASGGESSTNGGESSEDEESSSSGDDHMGEASRVSVDADILRLLSIQPLWLMSTVHQVKQTCLSCKTNMMLYKLVCLTCKTNMFH
ncbi:hypothetical protein HanXRQr2_Chr13g0598831 [Helianthus annuus]|uniref:Uncharacterized protein n=1 Tax=Helianthus annuus TaxID=4232 RepID=A0A9K3HDB3_HELAN|nr:hypothetical protein HanXRQr2_Chr13g0598831 [Helianthus annuus]